MEEHTIIIPAAPWAQVRSLTLYNDADVAHVDCTCMGCNTTKTLTVVGSHLCLYVAHTMPAREAFANLPEADFDRFMHGQCPKCNNTQADVPECEACGEDTPDERCTYAGMNVCVSCYDAANGID